MQQFRQPKIKTRLVVYYIAFAVATVVAVNYFAYTQATRSLETAVVDRLNTVASLKKESLDQWVDARQRDAESLASLPEMRSLSEQLLTSTSSLPSGETTPRQLAALLNVAIRHTEDFQDIQIIDLDGRVVASIVPSLVGVSQADQPFFIHGLSKTFIQNFYHSDLLGGTILTVATPLYNASEERVGVLALHFNMKRLDQIIYGDQESTKESVKTYLVDPAHGLIADDPLILAQATPFRSSAIDPTRPQESSSYINHNGVEVIGTYLWMEDRNAALIV